LAVPIGRWVDRGWMSISLLLGTLISLSVTIVLIFAESLVFVALCMPFLGIGHLLVMTGGQTMTANLSPQKSYERNFGLLTFYASVGHAVGPMLGGALADRGVGALAIDSALWMAAGLFAVAAFSVIPLARRARQKAPQTETLSPRGLVATFKIPTFKSALFISGSVTSVIDVMLVFLPVLGQALGFTATQVGLLLAVRAGASMLVRLFLSPIVQRFGTRGTLLFGSGATTLATVFIAFTSNFSLLLILMFVAGFATGIGQPMTMAWISRISPLDVRGLAISMRLVSNRLGQVIVPATAGFLASSGIGSIFLMLAGLQAASVAVTFRSGVIAPLTEEIKLEMEEQ
jgi:MFS family permease